MQITVEVPKAFSVRDENEFYAFQHLVARMNADLSVAQIATGIHVNGGCTVLWGLVFSRSRVPTQTEIETALAEAGFDFRRSGPLRQFSQPAASSVAAVA